MRSPSKPPPPYPVEGAGSVELSPPRSPMMSMRVPLLLLLARDSEFRPSRSAEPGLAGDVIYIHTKVICYVTVCTLGGNKRSSYTDQARVVSRSRADIIGHGHLLGFNVLVLCLWLLLLQLGQNGRFPLRERWHLL